ncbi:hypothetical protein KIH24_15125 [Rhizobiales bacterium TNE-4]|nr:hypothetical protein [Rhizobiales bacterium TNE-4]MBV1828955.1 hypothetical protein [Rhizobiales bacterium TNE-4]
MEEYILAIYDNELSNNDFIEMKTLCPGFIIEGIEPEQSQKYVIAFHQEFDEPQIGFAYKLGTKPDKVSLLFIRFMPRYAGKMTHFDEVHFDQLYDYCDELHDTHDEIYDSLRGYDFEQYEFIQFIGSKDYPNEDDQYGPEGMLFHYHNLGKKALGEFFEIKKLSTLTNTI